jgi:hypothetical protein
VPANIARIASLPPEHRSRRQRRALERYYFEQDHEMAALRKKRVELLAKLRNIDAPTTLVMQELAEARATIVGYDQDAWAVRLNYHALPVEPEAIYAQPADVFAPCALGGCRRRGSDDRAIR